jgi:hypothetical protein
MTPKLVARLSAFVAIVGALAMPPSEAGAEPPCMGAHYWVGYWVGEGECPTQSLTEFCANVWPACGTPTSASCSPWQWGPDHGYSYDDWFAKVTCVYGES